MPRTPTRTAFTLLELTLVMVMFSIIGAVVTPVIIAGTDSYASARTLRTRVDAASSAIEQVRRVLREAPVGTGTRLDVVSATNDSIVFVGGEGVRLNGTTLELLTPTAAAPIARAVDWFDIEPIDDDGASVVTHENAHRFYVTLTIDTVTLTAVVFPRVNIGENN